MKHLLKSKKGLSTVVTTLIILVISVLLATVVTYYAMNMVSTRVIQEDGRITQLHIWVNTTTGSTQPAEAAFLFKNTGGRDALIDKITVRYQDIPWADVYYYITTDSVTVDLNFTNGPLVDGITIDSCNYTQATQDISLETGQSLLIYIDDPDTIDSLDIGTPVPIGVHSSNAIYYKETNVQAES